MSTEQIDLASRTAKKLLYVFSGAPYSEASGQDGLDALLMGAAFDQSVSALFLHDGLFLLKTDQNVARSGLKQFTRAFRALDDFGVENAYVCERSMRARGLSSDDFCIEIAVLSYPEITQLINAQNRVFTF